MMSGEMRSSGSAVVAGVLLMTASVSSFAQKLDYDAYKAKVEPVFLMKRAGHARCVVCHEANNSAFRLQPLAEGSSRWTDEQSRKNYENVVHLVVPGKPEQSKLLIHPLAKDAGGDEFHGGGRQFRTKDDPQWKAIADWVKLGS